MGTVPGGTPVALAARGRRVRVVVLAGLVAVAPVANAACGGERTASGTLPPIVTTTTSTTIATTTTTYPEYYVIQSGETLGSIAQKWETTIDVLVALNKIRNKNAVQAGQKLKLPPREPATTTIATTTTDAATDSGSSTTSP